jgi:ligand-binding sensor domain-containing protein
VQFTTVNSENSPFNGYFTGIAQDRQGDLWFTSTETGIIRYDGDSFHRFGEESGLGAYTASTRAPVADSQGHMWFGTRSFGLIHYDGTAFKRFTVEEDGLADGAIFSALVDRDGLIWFGTFGSGIMRHDGCGASTASACT